MFYVGAFDCKLREVALKVELDNEGAPGGGLAEYLQVPACNVAPCSNGVLILWHEMLDRLVGKSNDRDVAIGVLNNSER